MLAAAIMNNHGGDITRLDAANKTANISKSWSEEDGERDFRSRLASRYFAAKLSEIN